MDSERTDGEVLPAFPPKSFGVFHPADRYNRISLGLDTCPFSKVFPKILAAICFSAKFDLQVSNSVFPVNQIWTLANFF